MSLPKSDRNFRSNLRKNIPEIGPLTSVGFSQAIAAALHQEYGQTHAAIKTVVAVTQANQRAVKNWFEAKNAPRGHHLVQLVQHSDCVLEALLEASGRHEILRAKRFADAKALLLQMLKLMDEMSDQTEGESVRQPRHLSRDRSRS
jgi:hypothetical protein